MRALHALLLALVLFSAPQFVRAQANQQADATPLEFRDAVEERRFHALAAELLCVMCQPWRANGL